MRPSFADVTDEAAGDRFFHATVELWGRLDMVVNSAGRDSLSPPVTEVTLEEWNKTIGPNLTGVFLCCREAFRIMEKQESGGRIINMGSSSARLASGPGHCPYRASKHGMMGFSKNILLEGMNKKIGVTVINPSHVKTPMTEIIDKGLYDGTFPRTSTAGSTRRREGGDLRQLHRRGERRGARPLCRHPGPGRHDPPDRPLPHAQGASLRHGGLMRRRAAGGGTKAAVRGYHHLDLVTAAFVTVLIVSNVASSAKIVDWGVSLFGIRLAFDAGTILFPVSYIFGDVLTEVYGYRRSRRRDLDRLRMPRWRAPWSCGWCASCPAEAGWQEDVGQEAYVHVLGGMSSGGIVAREPARLLRGGSSPTPSCSRG